MNTQPTPPMNPEETPFCDKAAFDAGACQCDDEPYMVICLTDAKELETRAILAERTLVSADREIERLKIVAEASDTASEDFELRQQLTAAERGRDELRKMLAELLIANASPSITGFAQACEKARNLITRPLTK